MEKSLADIKIRQSEPGDAGYVAYMHGRYYRNHYGFNPSFEYYSLKYLSEFVRDPSGGKLWIAVAGDKTVGSAAIVPIYRDTAQFRWFLVEDGYQNMGIGSKLINTALDFCRENNYSRVFLWTFKGLNSARHLYDKTGFALIEEKSNYEWSNKEIIEQKMELILR